MSEPQTHKTRCDQLLQQRRWHASFDPKRHIAIEIRVASKFAHGLARRGSGENDGDVLEGEMRKVMYAEDASPAIPP